MITGGNDHEQRREGDTLPKDQRYDRTRQAIQIYKRAWTETEPFDAKQFGNEVIPLVRAEVARRDTAAA